MPTLSRAKTPRTHSYPIGLEQIQAALEPECGSVEVIFECYPVGLQSQGYAYRVLTFTPGDQAGPPRLVVAATRRELKETVQQLVATKALPYLRAAKPAPGMRIEFHFDEVGGELLGPRLVGLADVPTDRDSKRGAA